MANPVRNWCNLPPDILGVICKKLPDIHDFVMFHAVCKDWRSCKCDPPLLLPWIAEQREDIDEPRLRFYSLFSGKIHTITCARSCGKYLTGPSHHYQLASGYDVTNYGSVYFLNPLTNNEITLPREIFWVAQLAGIYESGNGELLCFSNYGIVNLYSSKAISWRQESEDQDNAELHLTAISTSMLYYKGNFFCVDDYTGKTEVMDITTQKLIHELPPVAPHDHVYNFWTVEVGEEIFQLRKKAYSPYSERFCIHRLDLKNGLEKASWVKVNSIGEYVLFLDEYQGLSFCTRDYKGLGDNCFYLLQYDTLCKYDIKDGTVENMYCPFGGCKKSWFTPRPNSWVL